MSTAQATAPPVAIIGMSCRFPGADSTDAYWSNLVREVDSIDRGEPEHPTPVGARRIRAVGRIPDIELFDAAFFRIPPVEAEATDPQQRVLLEVAASALEDAGYAGPHDRVVGVFAGCGENLYYTRNLLADKEFTATVGETRIALGNEKDFLAPRIAFKLGLKGPSISVQASCSTSLTAVVLACQALAAGDCDLAIAGGVSLLPPDVDGYEYVPGGISSADGYCRAFDRRASGAVPGSGAGLVVLKLDAPARADGDNRYAVIRGWAVNNDGGSRAGFTVPNVDGQESVVRTAQRRAGVRPGEVSYVETHGTGTPLGDAVEIEALARVFSDGERAAASCAIGSVKTSIGHTDAAAGVAGLIKAALAVRHGVIPASLHFKDPGPEALVSGSGPLYVAAHTAKWPASDGARIAGVSSFGLGGTNAHVIVAGVQAAGTGPAERPRQLLTLSARTEPELQRALLQLADWLAARTELSPGAFADVAYTLAVGRPAYGCRWSGVFGDPGEAVSALRSAEIPKATRSRWTLAVEGAPLELIGLLDGTAPAEPLLREAVTRLTAGAADPAGTGLLGDRPAAARGALAALSYVVALQHLGCSFARIDAPPWARPAFTWLQAGGTAAELPGALDACVDTAAVTHQLVRPHSIVVRAGFDLTEAIAILWRGGADIDWRRFYGRDRRRVSVPTSPFNRQRYWRQPPDAVVSRPETPTDTAPVDDAGRPVPELVAAVWRDVLGTAEVGPHDHFIDDLGGDSLIAVEIGACLIDKLGVQLPLDLPFQTPTVALMSAYIESIQQAEATK